MTCGRGRAGIWTPSIDSVFCFFFRTLCFQEHYSRVAFLLSMLLISVASIDHAYGTQRTVRRRRGAKMSVSRSQAVFGLVCLSLVFLLNREGGGRGSVRTQGLHAFKLAVGPFIDHDDRKGGAGEGGYWIA